MQLIYWFFYCWTPKKGTLAESTKLRDMKWICNEDDTTGSFQAQILIKNTKWNALNTAFKFKEIKLAANGRNGATADKFDTNESIGKMLEEAVGITESV